MKEFWDFLNQFGGEEDKRSKCWRKIKIEQKGKEGKTGEEKKLKRKKKNLCWRK